MRSLFRSKIHLKFGLNFIHLTNINRLLAPLDLWSGYKLMNDLLKKLQTLSPVLFDETPVLFAYLYGSYAQDQAHPLSSSNYLT